MTQLPGRKTDDCLIERRGISVDLYQNYYCPCYDLRSGQPNYNHAICGGTGRQYLPAQTIKALITNVKQDKSYSIVGVWELGTCRCTTKASVNIGAMDRVIFKNLMLTYTELINRKERPLLNNKDMLRFYSVEKINIIKSLTKTFIENTDYKLIKDSNFSYIEWQTGGQKPADNEQYSVLYEHRPEFVAWDIPQVRTDSDNYQLPKFVVLRRKDQISVKAV